MNKVQKTYTLAKAAYETAEETAKRFVRDWLKNSGVHNPDGSIPENFCTFDAGSEEEWDRLCEQCGQDGANKLCEEKKELRKLLAKAEDDMIDWGLSLPEIPANVKDTLNRNRKEYKVRQRLIDLTYRVKA